MPPGPNSRRRRPVADVAKKVGAQMDRNDETRIVKQALLKAGYRDVKVGHSRGTAWGWLDVRITADRTPECDCRDNDVMLCTHCRDIDRKATELVQKVTGRHGEYDGRIP